MALPTIPTNEMVAAALEEVSSGMPPGSRRLCDWAEAQFYLFEMAFMLEMMRKGPRDALYSAFATAFELGAVSERKGWDTSILSTEEE